MFTTPGASACSCAFPEWQVELESVTSSDPAVNHQSLWFQRGELTSYEGHAHIWTVRYVNGVVSRVGAGE